MLVRKGRKAVLSVAVSAVLVASMCPVAALADEAAAGFLSGGGY